MWAEPKTKGEFTRDLDRQLRGDLHDGGTGSVLVLLHGVGATWSIWKPVLAALEARHRVIALTLPGHDGGKPVGNGGTSIAALTDATLEQLRQLGITSAHVAGNSLGGWIALELERRGFARSVTALSPAGGWASVDDRDSLIGSMRLLFMISGPILGLLSPVLSVGWLRRLLLRQTLEHGERIEPATLREMLRSMVVAKPLVAKLLTAIRRDGPLPALAPSSTPITVAWGECDRVLPFPRYGQPLLEQLPGAELVMIDGVGHVPLYDDPATIAATILATAARAEALQSVTANVERVESGQ